MRQPLAYQNKKSESPISQVGLGFRRLVVSFKMNMLDQHFGLSNSSWFVQIDGTVNETMDIGP